MARKCDYCSSRKDVILCYASDATTLMCSDCRYQFFFDDNGYLKEGELNRYIDSYDWQAMAIEEGEPMSSEESAFVQAILG